MADSYLTRDPQPVTANRITRELQELGLAPGSLVIIHSSLSTLGYVLGGARGALQGLLAALGPKGTLVVPAHSSENSDPSQWCNPPVPEDWWDTIRAEMPAFDPARTPSRGMGAIPELLRTWPGALRSDHPTCSFAALGPRAEAITRDQTLSHPLGEGGPLARLYEHEAQVLLLGVGHERNTSLHLAEHRSGTRPSEEQFSAVRTPAGRAWVSYEMLSSDDDRFPALGAAYERERAFRSGRVGGAEVKLYPQRDLVDFGARWLGATGASAAGAPPKLRPGSRALRSR